MSIRSAFESLNLAKTLVGEAKALGQLPNQSTQDRAVSLINQACLLGKQAFPDVSLPLAIAIGMDLVTEEQVDNACLIASKSIVTTFNNSSSALFQDLSSQQTANGSQSQDYARFLGDVASGDVGDASAEAASTLKDAPSGNGYELAGESGGQFSVILTSTSGTDVGDSYNAVLTNSFQPVSLSAEMSDGTSEITTYATDGSSTTIDYSGQNGTGSITGKDVENPDGTSALTTYNSAGSITATYSGHDGTGIVTGKDIENADGTSVITANSTTGSTTATFSGSNGGGIQIGADIESENGSVVEKLIAADFDYSGSKITGVATHYFAGPDEDSDLVTLYAGGEAFSTLEDDGLIVGQNLLVQRWAVEAVAANDQSEASVSNNYGDGNTSSETYDIRSASGTLLSYYNNNAAGGSWTADATTMQLSVEVSPASGKIIDLSAALSSPGLIKQGTVNTVQIAGQGQVEVSGTISIPNLIIGDMANGGGSLTLAGGTVVTDPTTVYASGSISGYGSLVGDVTSAGTIGAAAGTLKITGNVKGGGTLAIASNSTLELDASVVAGKIAFSGATGTLQLGFNSSVSSPLTGFTTGDKIGLVGDVVEAVTYNAAAKQLDLLDAGGKHVSVGLQGTYVPANFGITADGEVDYGAASSPSVTSVGTGPDQLALKLSEDAYHGDARYTVSVDGQQIGGTQVATVTHGSVSDTLQVNGNWGAGAHTFTVDFLNDLYGGSASADRNLYVDSATYNGVAVPGAQAALYQSGPLSLSFNQTPPVNHAAVGIGTGPDQLALDLGEDAYQGNAEYTVSVDGQQIGGTQTAYSGHGSASDTLLVNGNWAPGAHSFTIDFLNDLYGGSASADRNLYVDSATYNGATVSGAHAALYQGGPQSFAFHTATTPS